MSGDSSRGIDSVIRSSAIPVDCKARVFFVSCFLGVVSAVDSTGRLVEVGVESLSAVSAMASVPSVLGVEFWLPRTAAASFATSWSHSACSFRASSSSVSNVDALLEAPSCPVDVSKASDCFCLEKKYSNPFD